MSFYTIDFRITGEHINKDEINHYLSLKATRFEEKGWRTAKNGKDAPALWIFDPSEIQQEQDEWGTLAEALNSIYPFLIEKKDKFELLKQSFDVYLWVGCFIDSTEKSTLLSIELIHQLHQLNLQVYFESYVIADD